MKKIFLFLILTMTIIVFSGKIFYTIQFGDTLYSISKKLNIPLKYLIEKNEIKDPYIVKPGQKILISKYSDVDFSFIEEKITYKKELMDLLFNNFYRIAHHNFEYPVREKFMYDLINLFYEYGYYNIVDESIDLITDNNYKEKTILLSLMHEIKENKIHNIIKKINEIENNQIKNNLKYTLSKLLINSEFNNLATDLNRQSKKVKPITLENSIYKNINYYMIKDFIQNQDYTNSFDMFSNYIIEENISPQKLLTIADLFLFMFEKNHLINDYKNNIFNLFVISWLMI